MLPSFMVQFGLNGDPDVSSSWRAKTITDEPVKVTNKPGYMTFAKTGAPNSRTTQLFINYVDNGRLDGMGFAPFAEVEGDGMKVRRRRRRSRRRSSRSKARRYVFRSKYYAVSSSTQSAHLPGYLPCQVVKEIHNCGEKPNQGTVSSKQ